MGKIEKIREDLYIKKGWDGFRVVHPLKIDLEKPFEKGNINWKNVVGHWSYWLKGFIFLIALWLFVQAYLHDTKQCRDFVNNIDVVCSQYASTLIQVRNYNDNLSSQIPILNASIFNSIKIEDGKDS